MSFCMPKGFGRLKPVTDEEVCSALFTQTPWLSWLRTLLQGRKLSPSPVSPSLLPSLAFSLMFFLQTFFDALVPPEALEICLRARQRPCL